MKTNKKWVIQDWTGKELTAFGSFNSFEDGWSAIYDKIEDKDNSYDDYYVIEAEEVA